MLYCVKQKYKDKMMDLMSITGLQWIAIIALAIWWDIMQDEKFGRNSRKDD